MRAWILLFVLAGVAIAAVKLRGGADDPADAGAADPGADSPIAGLLAAFGGDGVSSTWSMPANPYEDEIRAAEVRYRVPVLGRVLWQESRFRPEIIDGRVVSSTGALGIAQFMPATAAELGIDPLDPHQAIVAAAKYLRSLFNSLGDWTLALAAYNWGIGNVQRHGIDAAPKETQDYVAEILADVNV